MNSYENARLAESFGGGQQIGLGIEEERARAFPSTANYTSSGASEDSTLELAVQFGEEFMATLDNVFYKSKPQGLEFGAITKRLQQAGPTTCTPEVFCDHVKNGGTWVGAVYEPSGQGWGSFIGQQLFGLDFDNSYSGAPLLREDPRFLDPLDALIRCEELGLDPICLYFTFSAQCPDWPKFRLVFDMGELLDEKEAKRCLLAFLNAFPEADQACKNPNRLYLGSKGEVWRYWGAGD